MAMPLTLVGGMYVEGHPLAWSGLIGPVVLQLFEKCLRRKHV